MFISLVDHSDSMISGIMGMGYGFYGFVEQTQMTFGGKFSYCMQSQLASSTSNVPMYLRVGSDVLPTPRPRRGMKNTPIYRFELEPAYYLTLEDISVGSRRLHIPPELFTVNNDGTGGFLLDSGSTMSYLIEDAYAIFERAIIDYINENNKNTRKISRAEMGYQLCYERYKPRPSSVKLPDVTFHFRSNADYVIPSKDVFFAGSTNRDHNDMYCLNFFDAKEMSLMGVLHQVDKRIIYDTQNSMLSFGSANCAREN
ncbi:hypothetical protein vseg_008676 [Gypsophila vaccaria]